MMKEEAKLNLIGIKQDNLKENLAELLKIMEENMIKREPTIILLHRVVNTDDDYDLKQQVQINNKIDDFVNGMKREPIWKNVLELLEVKPMLCHIFNMLSYPESLKREHIKYDVCNNKIPMKPDQLND